MFFGEFKLFGIYNENLCEEFGVLKPLYSSYEFSAMGFVEVLPLKMLFIVATASIVFKIFQTIV